MSRLRRWRQRLGLRRGVDLGGALVVLVPEQNARVPKGYHGQGLVPDPLLGLLAVLEVPGGPRRLDPAAKGNGTISERPREGPTVSRERARASRTPRRCALGPEDLAGRGDELPLLVDVRAHDDRPAREEVRRGLAVLAKQRSEVVDGRVAGALDVLELLSCVVLLLRLPGPPRAAALQGAYERGRSGGSQGREGFPRRRPRTFPHDASRERHEEGVPRVRRRRCGDVAARGLRAQGDGRPLRRRGAPGRPLERPARGNAPSVSPRRAAPPGRPRRSPSGKPPRAAPRGPPPRRPATPRIISGRGHTRRARRSLRYAGRRRRTPS